MGPILQRPICNKNWPLAQLVHESLWQSGNETKGGLLIKDACGEKGEGFSGDMGGGSRRGSLGSHKKKKKKKNKKAGPSL